MEKKFRQFTIHEPQEPPTTAELEQIEQLLGTKLPFEFVEFLNSANGGVMNYCIEIAEVNDIFSFCSLFSTRSLNNVGTKAETFVYEILASRETFETPREVLPFAIDGGGSTLFLDLTEKGCGRIVAFVFGLPAWTGRPSENTFLEVAPNFVSYLEKLFQCEDLD